MLFSGAMPGDCFTIVYVTCCPEQGRSFNFDKNHLDGYIGFFPPGGLLDAYTPEAYSNATLTVPVAVFLEALQHAFPEMPDSMLKSGTALRVQEKERVRMMTLLRSVERLVEDPKSPLSTLRARKNLESQLLEFFLDALRSGVNEKIPEHRISTRRRMNRLKNAREYVREHSHEPLTLRELCEAIGMSKRGLEVMFHESIGISPGAFIRHQRLHGVRRSLLATTPRRGVVKESALDWGFWHMGHFASSYHTLFGEKPSETLGRADQ